MSYPIQLDVDGMQIVVIGGGSVAERRIERLLTEGAKVRVVAPEVTDWIAQRASEGAIVHASRRFRAGDIDDARLAFAATDNPDVNRKVAEEARSRKVFVNVADRSTDGDFSVPAVADLDPVRLAIDTGGASPALAGKLRRHLESTVDPGWGRAAEILGRLRADAVSKLETDTRRRFFRELVDSLPEALTGDTPDALAWLADAARNAGVEPDTFDWQSYIQ